MGKLHVYAAAGDLKAIKSYLAKLPSAEHIKAELNEFHGRGTVLHAAICANHAEVVFYLLAQGAEPNIAFKDEYQSSGLWLAAENDNIEMLKALMDAGANPNYVNTKGNTLVHFLAQENQIAILEMLAPDSLLINMPNNLGFTPLLIAVQSGHADSVKYLLESGADPKIYEPLKGNSALHYALQLNRIDIMSLLIKFCSDLVHMPNHEGWQPIHSAAYLCLASSLKLLVKYGADVHAECRSGTPIRLALISGSRKGSPEQLATVIQLLGNGVDANKTCYPGRWPLVYAAWHNNEALLRLLLPRTHVSLAFIKVFDKAIDKQINALLITHFINYSSELYKQDNISINDYAGRILFCLQKLNISNEYDASTLLAASESVVNISPLTAVSLELAMKEDSSENLSLISELIEDSIPYSTLLEALWFDPLYCNHVRTYRDAITGDSLLHKAIKKASRHLISDLVLMGSLLAMNYVGKTPIQLLAETDQYEHLTLFNWAITPAAQHMIFVLNRFVMERENNFINYPEREIALIGLLILNFELADNLIVLKSTNKRMLLQFQVRNLISHEVLTLCYYPAIGNCLTTLSRLQSTLAVNLWSVYPFELSMPTLNVQQQKVLKACLADINSVNKMNRETNLTVISDTPVIDKPSTIIFSNDAGPMKAGMASALADPPAPV